MVLRDVLVCDWTYVIDDLLQWPQTTCFHPSLSCVLSAVLKTSVFSECLLIAYFLCGISVCLTMLSSVILSACTPKQLIFCFIISF